jgi:hypothetical protein
MATVFGTAMRSLKGHRDAICADFSADEAAKTIRRYIALV